MTAVTPKSDLIWPTFPPGVQEGTDAANAHILAASDAKDRLRYTTGLGWLVYQPTVGTWQPDPDLVRASQVAGEVLRKAVGQHLVAAIEQRSDEGERKRRAAWANRVCSVATVRNALLAAAGLPEFLTPLGAWDAHPHLFNCTNGVLDLRRGQLHEHRPADLLTWQAGAAFDPQARHPAVNRLLELLKEDGRHDFLQRSVGSALYGEAPNEVLTVLQGAGGTGKGTLVTAVMAMLGDYAATADVALLLNSARGEAATGPKPELVALRGKRLVVAGEPPKGARFNASRVKGMTGNDLISARGLHQPPITFTPVFKLWVHTNYPVGAAHDDSGMQRRLTVVPFNAKPERPDPNFKKILEHDPVARSALLNWALEGCQDWLGSNYGLGTSEAVNAATTGYWTGQNPYEQFVTERLSFRSDAVLPASRLKALFEEWADEQKLDRDVKIAELYIYLQDRGCTPERSNVMRFWRGVTEVTAVTP